MQPSYIEFVTLREIPISHVPKWWDRPRWWLVKLLGGKNPNDTIEVRRIPVNGRDFAERLFRQKREITEQFRRKATTIWMGAEDYQELMDSPLIREQFTMYSSFNYGKHEVFGLTVNVIPWMHGILVMP